MSDLISRAELFNKLSTLHSEDLKYQADVYMVINSMEPVEIQDEETDRRHLVCEEMKKLREILDNNDIEWRDDSSVVYAGLGICRTKFRYAGWEKEYSVIHGFGTYGGPFTFQDDEGLLELMVPCGKVFGHLTAEEVMQIVFFGERPDDDE